MFNPLLPDLSKLKNEDVDNKITELMKKYTIAARSGQGTVCSQIVIILDSYKQEQLKRQADSLKKLENKSRDFEDFINVDR